MPESLPQSDPVPPVDPASPQDKAERIEQLLLTGLDSYFAGEYEQAINIWTRVSFLERGHSRARAYIERARGALAERHRESEELLHQGLAAFDDGDTDVARSLITRAVERGAPPDVALVLLERLNRLASTGMPPEPAPPPRPPRRHIATLRVPARHAIWWPRAAVVVGMAAVGAFAALLSGSPLPDWLADPAGMPRQAAVTPTAEPLPVPQPSERLIDRARALREGGHLRDALLLLEGVRLGDPFRPEADRLRADIQRRLLEAAPGAER